MYGDFNQLFGPNNWDKSDPNSNFKIDFSTIMGDGINTAPLTQGVLLLLAQGCSDGVVSERPCAVAFDTYY